MKEGAAYQAAGGTRGSDTGGSDTGTVVAFECTAPAVRASGEPDIAVPVPGRGAQNDAERFKPTVRGVITLT